MNTQNFGKSIIDTTSERNEKIFGILYNPWLVFAGLFVLIIVGELLK